MIKIKSYIALDQSNQSIKYKYISLPNKNKYSNSLLQCYYEFLSKCHVNLQVAEYLYITLSSSIITIFNTCIAAT